MKKIQSLKLTHLSIVLMAIALNTNYAQASGSITATAKASATLAAVCTISAQAVNFGQIALPVGAQSATSNMNVTCTKNSSYTISLAYGGVYGQGGQSANLTLTSGSKVAGGSACNYGGTVNGTYQTVYYYNYGSPYCPSTYSYSSTPYGYGKMSGAANGDSIAYSIQVPGNSSEIWNSGNYSYTATGTGSNQTIPVVVTLVPSQTANQYPSADNYLDTVTATINY